MDKALFCSMNESTCWDVVLLPFSAAHRATYFEIAPVCSAGAHAVRCIDSQCRGCESHAGIKNVEYDVFRNKVTVTGTATVADVLSAARRHFKDAELYD
jgi:hypothetical protein